MGATQVNQEMDALQQNKRGIDNLPAPILLHSVCFTEKKLKWVLSYETNPHQSGDALLYYSYIS